jgi:hypothetical protein
MTFARGFLCALGFFAVSSSSFARPAPSPDYVCVRNFIPQDSKAAEAADASLTDYDDIFVHVLPAENREMEILTKQYEPFYCSTSPKEFKWVLTLDERKICTVDFHQEGITEYCYSNPKIFSWARLTSAPD